MHTQDSESTASYRGSSWFWDITGWEITHHFRGICGIYLELIKGNQKIATLQPVGLGNTRFLTNYVQRSPWMLNLTIDRLEVSWLQGLQGQCDNNFDFFFLEIGNLTTINIVTRFDTFNHVALVWVILQWPWWFSHFYWCGK